MCYVQEFSSAAKYYCKNKTEESAVHRIAALICSTMPSHHFDPKKLMVSQFFIDLHTVMTILPPDGDTVWACQGLLQHCSRNLAARNAIVYEYRFMPLLAHLLKRTVAPDKCYRLLLQLEDLSFNMRLNWEEPYIVVLLEHLVSILYNNETEERNAAVALSVLINLCYKNFAIKFLFMRSVYISSFSKRIQQFGMLANKMIIVLSEDMHVPEEKDLHLFLQSSFAGMCDCLKTWHVPHMRHIVEFLSDENMHANLQRAMLNYERYSHDVEKLLNQVDNSGKVDKTDEDGHQHQAICMSLLFKCIQHILKLSALPNHDGSENGISIDSNISRVYEMLQRWIHSSVCGDEAINLLTSLITTAKKESVVLQIAREPTTLVELITLSKQSETTAPHTTAILKLLLALLLQSKTEKIILSKITESYFNKILEPLLTHNAETPLEPTQIEKYTYCLLLMVNFAIIAKKSYSKMCGDLLQLPQVRRVLARAMVSGCVEVSDAVFKISQFEYFPHTEVSREICKLNSNLIQQQENDQQWRDTTAVLKYHKLFIGKAVEQRLQGLIEVINEAYQNNQLNNVATSQIIELYNYKIEKHQCAEELAQKKLEHASDEITHLLQRMNLQNAELQKYHTMNFELHVNIENLQTHCTDLKKQKDDIKQNMTEQMKLLSEQKKSLQTNERQLAIKSSEFNALQKEHHELNEQLTVKTEELEKMQAISKENVIRIDKLKKSIVAFELDIKEKQHSIEEKERDFTKAQKTVEELRDSKKKSDGVIAVLEAQLQEKNDKIKKYEQELNESEEVRKAIMSLMVSKKPKRSAN